MANIDAKTWLEGVTLDEDNMISDSAYDVATQQSIKAYTDEKITGGSAAMAPLNITYIDHADSPYAATFGEVIQVDTTTALVNVNLPLIGASYGSRITVIHDTGAFNCRVYANVADDVMGNVNMAIGDGFGEKWPLTLTAMDMGGKNTWRTLSSSTRLVAGDGSVDATYIPLISVSQATTDLMISAQTSLDGLSDGFVIESLAGASHVTVIRSTNGVPTLIVSAGSDSQQPTFKLRHETSGNEWDFISTLLNYDLQIKLNGGSYNALTCDQGTEHVGLATSNADPVSPIRLGDATNMVPTFTDNATAKVGGLTNGAVYRLADGTLMVVYT